MSERTTRFRADDHECLRAETLATMERELGTLNKTVFLGNSKPSLVTQIATMQQTLNGMLWTLRAVAVAVIAQIVLAFFKGM